MTTDKDDLPPLPASFRQSYDGLPIYHHDQMRTYAQAARAPLLAEIERWKEAARINGLSFEKAERERDELRARLDAIRNAQTYADMVLLVERLPRTQDPLEGKLGFWPIERLK